MKRSIIVALACLLVGGGGLSASGARAASHQNASTKPPKLKKNVSLSMWNFFANTDPEYAAQQGVLTALDKKYTIKVGNIQNPSNPANKFQLGAPTGNAPDLLGVPHDQVAQLVSAKVVAPVPAWAWSSADQKKYISAAVKAATLSGHPYAMPWAIETTGLFYNKALISTSAFKPAKGDKYLRWSTLLPRLQKLTDLGAQKYGFVMDMDNFYYDYAFLSGEGGYVFKYVKGKGFNWQQVGLGSSAAVKAIQFYADLSTSGKYKLVPPSINTTTADGLFQAGKAAVEWTGPWNEGNFRSKNINFGFAPLPSFDGKHPMRPFSTVQMYLVNKFSKNVNESFAALKYITQNMELPVFKAAGRIPVIKSDLASKTVQGNSLAKQLAAAALAADPIPNIPEMNAVWTPAAADWQQVALGKASAQAAAAASLKDVQSAITKMHGG
ncbi:MAG: extracellular solute-binding protein [Chloroflexi bacterium]|nr:extracellular solute-binding protein [Chloroflexota bacterium]